MDASEIKKQLARRALEVCRYLLPNGRIVGREYHVGSASGEAGDSLRIHIGDDSRAGVWTDFACNEKGGDLIELWRKVRNSSFLSALDEIRDVYKFYSGGSESAESKAKPEYRQPSWADLKRRQVLACYREPALEHGRESVRNEEQELEQVELSPVVEYLTGKRKILPSTLKMFRIAEKPPGIRGPHDARVEHGWAICFPYFDAMNSKNPPFNVKYVELNRRPNGGKIEWQEYGARPGLFGWQAITANDKFVILTEGEIDAMTWVQWGFPALSVPMGAGGGHKQLKWIEEEFENLARFETIYICLDNEQRPDTEDREALARWEKKAKAVSDAVAVISSRLGNHRCARISLPDGVKDPNDGIQRGMTYADAKKCVDTARYCDPELLKSAHSFIPQVKEMRRQRHLASMGMEEDKEDSTQYGYHPHWAPKRMVIPRGATLIVHGLSHHGKSEFCRFTALNAMTKGFRIATASFEEPPMEQMDKLVQMASASEDIDDMYMDDVEKWIKDRMWIYEFVGTAKLSDVLETMKYAVKRYGVDIVVIDSMTMLEPEQNGPWKDDKFESQTATVRQLINFGKANNVIVMLVCHDTKGIQDPEGHPLPPQMQEIQGVNNIANLVHHVWLVYRDKRKTAYSGKKASPNETYNKTLVMVQKDKPTGLMPTVPFTFHEESKQFLLEGREPRQYVKPSVSHGQQRLQFRSDDEYQYEDIQSDDDEYDFNLNFNSEG